MFKGKWGNVYFFIQYEVSTLNDTHTNRNLAKLFCAIASYSQFNSCLNFKFPPHSQDSKSSGDSPSSSS
jgi:hypothetical protein